jgi:hypothetical protein
MQVEKDYEDDFYNVAQSLRKNKRRSMEDLPTVPIKLRHDSTIKVEQSLPKRLTMMQSLPSFNFKKLNHSTIPRKESSSNKLNFMTKKFKNLNSDNLKSILGDFEENACDSNSRNKNRIINDSNSSTNSGQKEFLQGNSTRVSSKDSPKNQLLTIEQSNMVSITPSKKKSVLGIFPLKMPVSRISGFRSSAKSIYCVDFSNPDISNLSPVKKKIFVKKILKEDEDMLPKQRMIELKKTILKDKDKMKDVLDSLKRQQTSSKDKLKTFISNLHMQKLKGLK